MIAQFNTIIIASFSKLKWNIETAVIWYKLV